MSFQHAPFLVGIGAYVFFGAGAVPAQNQRNSVEYAFFQTYFQRANQRADGVHREKELNEAFQAISDNVAEIQRFAPNVTLGAMLSLIVYESGDKLAFYNTRDSENSFDPGKKLPGVPKLAPGRPFWRQPLARYSYQLGLVPIHMSNFRPCIAGTQSARKSFDTLAQAQGIAPTTRQLASVQQDFAEVCQKALKPVEDHVQSVDYFILAAHTVFNVPKDNSGSDLDELESYPLYFVRITTPLFFIEILNGAKAGRITDDSSAIFRWGGGDPPHKQSEKQARILRDWTQFSIQKNR